MVYNRVKVFVTDAGKIIVAISIILWFLSSHGLGKKYNKISEVYQSMKLLPSSKIKHEELQKIETLKLEYSFIGVLGKVIEPAIKPLGFDWKIGIALISSFAAREVFVGTMATIYQSGDTENTESIKQKLLKETNDAGEPLYSAAVCWSLLIFYAFAMQCMSTMAVVKRETKSWKWVIAQLTFMSGLAYCSALLVFNLLN